MTSGGTETAVFCGGREEDVVLLDWEIDKVFAVEFNTLESWAVCRRDPKFDVGILLLVPGLACKATFSNQNHITSSCFQRKP